MDDLADELAALQLTEPWEESVDRMLEYRVYRGLRKSFVPRYKQPRAKKVKPKRVKKAPWAKRPAWLAAQAAAKK